MEKKKIVRKKIKKEAPVEKVVKKEPEKKVTTSQSEIITPQIVFTPPTICTWRKKEGGTFRLKDGRKIKPTEVFTAYPDEIPAAFMDMFELVEGDPNVVERVMTAPSKFVVTAREDGLFDVVDIDGKKINDAPMAQVDAERLHLALAT